MVDNKKRKVPSTKKIIKWWIGAPVLDPISNLHKQCWACQFDVTHLERCHVVPHSLGGTDDCSNIVLMCEACHNAAPATRSQGTFWRWFRDRWIDRIELLHAHFARAMKHCDYSEEEIQKATEWVKSHLGQGRVSLPFEPHRGRSPLVSILAALKEEINKPNTTEGDNPK